VAGRRRFAAALAVAEDGGGSEPLPCAVIEAGDDAAALEASLIENIARLDPDEVSRWESFVRLVREGRSPEDIALVGHRYARPRLREDVLRRTQGRQHAGRGDPRGADGVPHRG
jgi:ParB-like chromosome segregation protein Spo0J